MATFLSIPDVVWSGVVGATITLVGVGFSNRGNTNRLKLQFKNDSAEKVRARLAELRRDVYLEFAEEFVAANEHVSSLPDQGFENGPLHAKLAGFFSASAKLQLICQEDTADLVADLTAKFQAIVLRSTTRAFELFQVKSKVDVVNSAYQQYESEVKRILAAMSAFNETAQTDQNVFAALQRSYEFNQSQTVQHGELRNNLWIKRNRLHVEYARATLADLTSLSPVMASAMVAIRAELELSDDPEHATARMTARLKRVQDHISAAMHETLAAHEAAIEAQERR